MNIYQSSTLYELLILFQLTVVSEKCEDLLLNMSKSGFLFMSTNMAIHFFFNCNKLYLDDFLKQDKIFIVISVKMIKMVFTFRFDRRCI